MYPDRSARTYPSNSAIKFPVRTAQHSTYVQCVHNPLTVKPALTSITATTNYAKRCSCCYVIINFSSIKDIPSLETSITSSHQNPIMYNAYHNIIYLFLFIEINYFSQHVKHAFIILGKF